jgi:hypothetical protein
MNDLTAKRTLVKSAPELWSELSEVERLARHLGAFGEIKITKLEPEHTVAWEGEAARGTVSIEPSGWGTKVTLTAQLAAAAPREMESPDAEDPPVEEAAVEEPAVEEPPVEEAPVEEPPVEEAPVEEPPVEEPPVEEPPVEEAPVEEPAVEEPPVDELQVEVPSLEPPRVETRIAPARRRKRGFFARLFGRRTASVDPPAAEPVAPLPVWVKPPPVEPEPVQVEPEPVQVEPEPLEVEPEPLEVATAEPVQVEPEPAEVGTATPVQVEPPPVEDPVDEAPDHDEAPADVDTGDPQDDPPSLDAKRAQAILDETLDTLGSAHHRPYSRS